MEWTRKFPNISFDLRNPSSTILVSLNNLGSSRQITVSQLKSFINCQWDKLSINWCNMSSINNIETTCCIVPRVICVNQFVICSTLDSSGSSTWSSSLSVVKLLTNTVAQPKMKPKTIQKLFGDHESKHTVVLPSSSSGYKTLKELYVLSRRSSRIFPVGQNNPPCVLAGRVCCCEDCGPNGNKTYPAKE